MAQLLLIRGARQLLTLRGANGVRRGSALDDLSIIEDGSVLIRDGIISQVGSTRRLENLKEARTAAEIAVNGAIVLPGFVDPAIQIAPEGIKGKKQKAADFFDQSLLLLRSFLQHGTLNAQVKAARQAGFASDVTLVRQLARIGDHPIGITRSWCANFPCSTAGVVDEWPATVSMLAKNKLVQTIEVDSDSWSLEQEKLCAAARQSGISINVLWRGGAAEVLVDLLDRLHPRALISSVAFSVAECTALSRRSVPVVFSTVKSLSEGNLNDSLQMLIQSGVPVALSSGYDTHEAPVFNMQVAIALAVLRFGLRTEQAISAATINAAHAVGLGHVIGSLEIGKRADLIVMNLPDYRDIPRRFGINHVGMAIREGKIAFNRTGWKVSAV